MPDLYKDLEVTELDKRQADHLGYAECSFAALCQLLPTTEVDKFSLTWIQLKFVGIHPWLHTQ